MNNTNRLLLSIAILALAYCRANATDLTKIDRTIPKEPAYMAKPKYCLLVFGPDAKDRAWLVLDGQTLHIAVNADDWITVPELSTTGIRTLFFSGARYNVEKLRVGARVHYFMSLVVMDLRLFGASSDHAKALLKRDPKAKAYSLDLWVDIPGWKGNAAYDGRIKQMSQHRDKSGPLQFADRPQDAPILHFGALPSAILETLDRSELQVGRDSMVSVMFGSVGVGPGTTTYYLLQGAPKGVHPTLEITFPPKMQGGPSIREKYDLKGVHSADFRGPVRVPDTAGAGKAKVSISFDSWPEPKFVPTQLEVAVTLPKKNEIKSEKSSPEK